MMMFCDSETGNQYSADDLYIDMLLNATASGMPDDPACVISFFYSHCYNIASDHVHSC